jgi:hypothetical protein
MHTTGGSGMNKQPAAKKPTKQEIDKALLFYRTWGEVIEPLSEKNKALLYGILSQIIRNLKWRRGKR